MNRFVVCLFKPDKTVPEWSSMYDWDWVSRLGRQLARYCWPAELVVLTDDIAGDSEGWVETLSDPHDGGFCTVIAKRFELDVPGWAKLMEIFRPDVIGERAIFMGLDTVVVGDLTVLWQVEGELGAPRDPNNPDLMCNGLLTIKPKIAEEIWTFWRENYRLELVSKRYRWLGLPFSEMQWLRQNASHRRHDLDAAFPKALLSYKAHVQGKRMKNKPSGCLAVYFHGTPKAPGAPEPWIRREWGDE